MLAKLRFPLALTSLLAALIVAVAIPATATTDAWTWKDQSVLLPYRDGVSVTQLSERQGSWLMSDGSHLMQFDGRSVIDLTKDARNRGIMGISSLASDGQSWLITTRDVSRSDSGAWLVSGSQWLDVSGAFRNSEGGLDVSGADGVWYARAWTRGRVGAPKTQTLSRWMSGTQNAATVSLPSGFSNLAPGCLNEGGATVCTGIGAPVFANGAWYLIGGSAESRTSDNRVLQAAKGMIWRLDGTNAVAIANLPEFKFVSGIWQSDSGILIATSRAVTNPYAADAYWVFDGTTMKNVGSQAASVGLLSVDAREVKATWTGRSWMIVFGKTLVRFDGTTMAKEVPTRDLFHTISSDGNGTIVLGGAVSETGSMFASSPLMAKLVTVTEDLSRTTDAAQVPVVTNLVKEILSKTMGPTVTVSGIPTDGKIGNGKAFVFKAEAKDADGIDRVDIYVHGTRVKTCFASACEYAQTYWTNGTPTKTVTFFARGVDKNGYGNDSATVTLTVDMSDNRSAYPVANTYDQKPASQPQNTKETYDAASGITWSIWTEPSTTALQAGTRATLNVSARDANGLAKIELYVNSASATKTCTFNKEKDTRICSFVLDSANYPVGTEIFANANIFDASGKNAWTSPVRVQRPAAPVVVTPTVIVSTPATTGPVFQSTASVEPNVTDVARGKVITFRSLSQNNTLGLDRVELVLNGAIVRKCVFGAAVSQVTCDHVVDTASIAEGTVLTFMAHAIDNYGRDAWSNAKSVTVRGTTYVTPTPTTDGSFSAWHWVSPSSAELWDGQTQTYSVGAWSPQGIRMVEVIANGRTLRSCGGTGAGTLECAGILSAREWSHGESVAVSARVTDQNGMVIWTPVHRVRVKRTWEAVPEPGPYVQVTTDHAAGFVNGERVTVTARGWSPSGTDRLELWVNGARVATCSSDMCSWQSQTLSTDRLEIDAKLIDRSGIATWAGVQGIRRK